MSQTNKRTSIEYILPHITIHRHESVSPATIIRVSHNNTNTKQQSHKMHV